MSELKAYRPYANRDGFYHKSEADKVIAELKKKLVEQATLRAWAEIQLRHNKYKRCLAMAQWCMDAECKTEKDADFLVRWEYRWLALAEEPTWKRFLQLIRKEAK